MNDSKRQSRQHILQLSRKQFQSIFQGLEFKDATRPLSKADLLSALEPRQRAFVEHWHSIAQRSDSEVASLFLQRAPQALQLMDLDGVEAWLLQALEQLDQRGLGWAVDVLNQLEQFASSRAHQQQCLALSDISSLLARLTLGLGGRELRIAAAELAYTDTETLFLPAEVLKPDPAEALALYKTMAVHHWAQTWYGTWQLAIVDSLLARPAQELVWSIFAVLERWRLDAVIARTLPGVYRQMLPLGAEATVSNVWQEVATTVRQPQASAATSLALIDQLVGRIAGPLPSATEYHGAFNPRQVQLKLQARLTREREQLRLLAGKLLQQVEDEEDVPPADSTDSSRQPRTRKPTEAFTLVQGEADASGRVTFLLQLAGQTLEPPDSMRELLGSIYQDLGEIPDDYIQGIGRRLYDASQAGGEAGPGYATGGLDGADRLLRLPEWDHTRNRFRMDYCILREYTIDPGATADAAFVTETRRKYHNLLKSIRRSFEILLGENRLERRQQDGDDIDLDALVQASIDARQGEEMNPAVYTRLHHNARSIAVMFMVDMSGSTKGWVNLAEREALVLLCEALETIGDRYAIYGFSGRTHQRVDVYRIKRFSESFNTLVKGRIAAIQPRAYTRLGAPIRYLGGLLKQEPARHKLLITLSDGKPEDYGSYYGQYGIEDTRHALLELRRDGVHPFCITIDKEGGDYLPHMYGPANYALIDDVSKLPLRVADIYRKLTT